MMLTQQWRYVNLTRNSHSCAHLRGATSSSFRGENFHELSFDVVIVAYLFNRSATFSQTVTDKVLFKTFNISKNRTTQF